MVRHSVGLSQGGAAPFMRHASVEVRVPYWQRSAAGVPMGSWPAELGVSSCTGDMRLQHTCHASIELQGQTLLHHL